MDPENRNSGLQEKMKKQEYSPAVKDILTKEYNKVLIGLDDLSRAVANIDTPMIQKLEAMERVYLRDNPIYNEEEQKNIKYFREAFVYKFHLVNLFLEQLWSLDHLGDSLPLKEVLLNIYDFHQIKNKSMELHSYAIEGFILQSAAYLDFYMLYLCFIFGLGRIKRLNKDKFLKALNTIIDEPHKSRADQVKRFFESQIYGENKKDVLLSNNWGKSIKELRDSIVHRDILCPDFKNNITLVEQIIEEWPEKENEVTCSRFCQVVQNAMFYQITKLAAVVYGLEWKPGPYKSDMW